MTRATTVEKTLDPPCGKKVVFLGWRPTVAGCLIAGLVQLLVGYLFYKAVPAVIPDVERQYKNGALFRPWPGWTSTYMPFHPIGFGAVFALVYCGLKSRCGFPSGWRGGGAFRACVFLVGSLPIFLIDYASFTVSVEIVASWILQNACQYLLSGASVGIVANLRGMVDRSP